MKYHIGGRYIAGHWESDIEKSLLWEIDDREWYRDERSAQLPSQGQYYAPSWSWASVSRPMRHNVALIPDIVEEKVDFRVLDSEFWPSTLNVNGPGLALLTMEAVVLSVIPPKSRLEGFQHIPDPYGMQFEFSYLGSSYAIDARGNQRPIGENDLCVVSFLRWPTDDIGAIFGLVFERVNEEEYRDWQLQVSKLCPQGPIQAEAKSNVNNLSQSRPAYTEAMKGNIFRRVGNMTALHRTSPWEEFAKQYRRTIYIT